MTRVSVVAVLLVLALGCGDDGPSPAMPDAHWPGVQVTGCDDPRVWTEPARDTGNLRASLRGGPCTGAQYPLSVVSIGWSGASFGPDEHLDRSCWRVVAASVASGWTAGDQFTGDGHGSVVVIKGFDRPLTLEGRVLRDDGTIELAVEKGTFALDAADIAVPNASAAVAVMTRDAWAERDVLHAWGQDVATDEIVDTNASPWSPAYPITLHRTANGFVRREWWDGTPIRQRELALGTGTRARVAEFGNAIVIDTELLFTGGTVTAPAVLHRVPLAAEPSELVGLWGGVLLHVGNSLAFHYIDSTTKLPAVRTLSVGTGVLLPAFGEVGYFFDGARFHRIDTYPDLAFDEPWSFSPRAEDLAMLGRPLAVHHGIVLGTNGLLAALDASSTWPGMRFASAADLYGTGARIESVAPETAAYIVRREDGTAAIHHAPFVDWCD